MNNNLSIPLVSVVTPVHQAKRFLDETVSSVLTQTYGNLELILIDDASTDGSYQRCLYWAEMDSRVKVLQNKSNLGAAISRNKGIDVAQGAYIAFLDADDVWSIKKLEYQLEFMIKNGCEFSFTAYKVESENGKFLSSVDTTHSNYSFDYDAMLKKQATLGCSTVMISRRVIGKLRMPNIRTGQDYAFWLLLLKKGNCAFLIPEPLTGYRIRTESLSRNKLKKARRQWQIYREIESLSFVKAAQCFLFYAFRAVFRKR